MLPAIKKQPLLRPCFGYVQAVFQSPAQDCIEEPIDLAKELVKNEPATYYFRVIGESMIEANMPVGCLLVVDRSITCRNGMIVIAVIDGYFTVKRFNRSLTGVELLPANRKFKPIEIHEFTSFQVWGVVTNIIINAKLV